MTDLGFQPDNEGISVLNPRPPGPVMTVGVTGLGRSGTTMVSRTLVALGLPMGEKLTPRTSEDKVIQTQLKAGDISAFGELCQARSAECAKWGFKVPALRGVIVKASRKMVEPRYVVTFRDIQAVSMRNNLSMGVDSLQALRSAAVQYVNLVDRLSKLDAPVLLVSYEKALANPSRFVEALAEFCGLSVDAAEIESVAAENVRNGDPRYMATAS